MSQNEVNRFELFYHILVKWLSIRQKNKTLAPYFEYNFISNVAVYGMGALGERLVDELEDSRVKVSFAIDRMADSKKFESLSVFGLDEDNYPHTELVIVTPVHDYWEIVELLQDRINVPIVSLEDIVDYCWSEDD